MNYENIKNKIEIVSFLKIAFDYNKSMKVDMPLEEDLDITIFLDEVTVQLLGSREINYCYLDAILDEETEEFTDYTGLFVYDFPHPIIHDFFKAMDKIKETQYDIWDRMTSIYDNKMNTLISKSFYDTVFIDFLLDKSGIYKGVKFTFSYINKPSAFLKSLLNIVETLKGFLEELERGGVNLYDY